MRTKLSGPELLLLSASALFWELTLIRYVPASVRVVGYFTNFVLLSTFLGLGAGTILAGRIKRPVRWFVPMVLLTAAISLLVGAGDTANPEGQYLWHGGPVNAALGDLVTPYARLQGWASGLGQPPAELVICGVALLLAATFVPLGAAIGERFRQMAPLRAYAWDIGGSLTGIVLFAALSWIGTTPLIWFAAGFALLTPLLWHEAAAWKLACAVAMVGALSTSWLLTAAYEWSPYQKIAVIPVKPTHLGDRGEAVVGYELKVNNDYHQMMLNLGKEAEPYPALLAWRKLYDAPYKGRAPGDVLVLGAGSGNDVMAALRGGARSVTAVDIDPVIVGLGRRLHHERPYADPRVTVVIDDARAFLQRSDRRFDTVVFGFLDSHTLLASMSSVRIDTFVYTLQSFLSFPRVLRGGGRIVMTFAANKRWIAERIYRLFEAAYGKAPTITQFEYTNGTVFSVTPDAARPSAEALAAAVEKYTLPTDDWPYFYLRDRSIPGIYLLFVLITLIMGTVPLLLIPRGERTINLQFLFLGAGFMLVETRSVTEMALLFGSTWLVNAITFGGILAMVFSANLVCIRWPRVSTVAAYGLVFACVVLHVLMPREALLSLEFSARLPAAILLLFSPIFFAGMCFSSAFRAAPKPHIAFGSNLLGAMIGGGIEYVSMVLGFALLDAFALCLYAAALLVFLRGRTARAC